MLMYVVSFLDRANVSFAKQALAATEGITESAYAMGAGLFFIGYSSCGFPSNLILHRIGAKIWIAFLMVTWGLVSMATMFVSGSTSFYVLRLLLGATEAGFFPGIILYLTYWFPRRVRGQMLGVFYLGVPLALIVGGPLSGFLLDTALPGKLQGWQVMFLVEGALAAVLGVFAFWFLGDRPADAKWLPEDEKRALLAELSREEAERRATGPAKLVAMLRDGRVFGFFAVYALIQMSTYGAVFYLPAEISGLLHKPEGFEVGAVSAIPWLCALAATYILPRLGDEFQNHRLLAILTLLIAGAASFAFPALRSALGTGNAFHRRLGIHRRAAAVLDLPHRLLCRSRRRRRHRVNRRRQPRRIPRPQRKSLGRPALPLLQRRPLRARRTNCPERRIHGMANAQQDLKFLSVTPVTEPLSEAGCPILTALFAVRVGNNTAGLPSCLCLCPRLSFCHSRQEICFSTRPLRAVPRSSLLTVRGLKGKHPRDERPSAKRQRRLSWIERRLRGLIQKSGNFRLAGHSGAMGLRAHNLPLR